MDIRAIACFDQALADAGLADHAQLCVIRAKTDGRFGRGRTRKTADAV
jgi:hypothetical protein